MQKVCVYSAKLNRRKTHTITATQNKTWKNNQRGIHTCTHKARLCHHICKTYVDAGQSIKYRN